MKKYPYSENRVYLSAVIAALSIVLGSALLLGQPFLFGGYLLAASAFTVLTYVLKGRLYTLLLSDEEDAKTLTESASEEGTPWKAMLLVLFMSIAFLVGPLLFSEVLGGSVWFILIVGFTSGVSISEVILYLQTRR